MNLSFNIFLYKIRHTFQVDRGLEKEEKQASSIAGIQALSVSHPLTKARSTDSVTASL